MKKFVYALVALGFVGIVTYRVVQISYENRRDIFNAERAAEIFGIPAETILVQIERNTLLTPVAVRDGRIFVANGRVHQFRPGQRLSNGGRITSVSRNIDMNTGLFIIRASGENGNHFAEMEYDGVFLPLSAISDNIVMVSENQIAVTREVSIIAADAERAVVTGLTEGDIVILTQVEPGRKIKPIN